MFGLNLSVPLFLEYEQVATRLVGQIALTETDINDILDYLCRTATHRRVYYLWRPLSISTSHRFPPFTRFLAQ